MEFEWDQAKAAANKAKHGVDFAQIHDFAWDAAFITEDRRRDYGETRYIGLGRIAGRTYVVVFTVRAEVVRVIGLRKANKREVAVYDRQKKA